MKNEKLTYSKLEDMLILLISTNKKDEKKRESIKDDLTAKMNDRFSLQEELKITTEKWIHASRIIRTKINMNWNECIPKRMEDVFKIELKQSYLIKDIQNKEVKIKEILDKYMKACSCLDSNWRQIRSIESLIKENNNK